LAQTALETSWGFDSYRLLGSAFANKTRDSRAFHAALLFEEFQKKSALSFLFGGFRRGTE
jgi:hypothetical protein